MAKAPGHIPGQPIGGAGVDWGMLVEGLVAEHGTLTAVAWKLIDRASGDDVASIERALRRLRGRGQQDGGVWGQRVLRAFGLPRAIGDRARWLGVYHSPFTDLPIALCLDQLRLWDRPPVSESPARVWIQLGFASCALRERRFAEAATALAAARAVAHAPLDARLELALAEGYLASRDARADADAVIAALLDHAEALLAALAAASNAPGDVACFRARLVDQRAYQHNRAGAHAAARALYATLPDDDVHPFASYRRDAGRAFAELRAGDRDAALALAHRACRHAGDGGYIRLRAMGLILAWRIAGDADALARARAIADRLGDLELHARLDRIDARRDR